MARSQQRGYAMQPLALIQKVERGQVDNRSHHERLSSAIAYAAVTLTLIEFDTATSIANLEDSAPFVLTMSRRFTSAPTEMTTAFCSQMVILLRNLCVLRRML